MGYIQESRAESAVAALRQMAAAHANVIRDGERREHSGRGSRSRRHHRHRGRRHHSGRCACDSIDRAANSRGGADRREPARVEGYAPIRKRSALGDRHNMIFSGTAATYGRGRAVVVATGMQTEMGRIAGMLKEAHRRRRRCKRNSTASARLLGLIVVIIAVVMIVDDHSRRRCTRVRCDF